MSNVKSTVAAALSNTAPAQNFITTDEAKGIVQSARADGKVTADEVAAVTSLQLQQTFFDDSPRQKSFEAPTASQPAFHELQKFLRQSSAEHAVNAAFSAKDGVTSVPTKPNFMTSDEARQVVGAAKADGVIDSKERATLGALKDGWSFHDDGDSQGPRSFAQPTLSMQAGQVINAALKGE